MNLKSEIVGVVLLLIIIIPIVYISRNKRKKEKEFLQILVNLANKNNFKIDEYTIWKNTAIGIDKTNQQLFFTRITMNIILEKEIDLSEIQNCKLVNTNKNSGNPNANKNAIHKIELIFTFRNNKKPAELLEFYNTDFDNLILSDELLIADKWSKIINSIILN